MAKCNVLVPNLGGWKLQPALEEMLRNNKLWSMFADLISDDVILKTTSGIVQGSCFDCMGTVMELIMTIEELHMHVMVKWDTDRVNSDFSIAKA